ncbi:unnamed protein product [Orchesella dallaii]|uniref:Uncharacterized protein n=1 Tax=Orchesella dallaii TaxID=48710 RepID=A0ABP1RV19_9HEXA
MEEWQREVIRKNMRKLIGNTICNETLTATLMSSNILSDNDIEDLTRELNQLTRARKLYQIGMTKDNGFEKLIEGLKEADQTGAFPILCDESIKRKNNGLGDITSVTYDKNNVLGKGSYGTVVYKGKFGNRDVAVKRINTTVLDGKVRSTVTNEVKTLHKCDTHENIVQFFGSKLEQDSVLIVLELCDITLTKWVAEKSFTMSPLEILKQVTVGLGWLHSQNFVHGDLKPDNILLNRELRIVKLADFGMSRLVGNENCQMSSVGTGTPGWVAPEILFQVLQEDTDPVEFTFASDLFSLGCIYYYVLSDGKHPFGDVFRRSANILDGKLMIDISDLKYVIPDNIKIIEGMISNRVDLRPSCDFLISCSVFWSNESYKSLYGIENSELENSDNTLVFRLTTCDITVGRLLPDENFELIPNWQGDATTLTLVGQTRENKIVYGLQAEADSGLLSFSKKTYVVRKWSLWGLFKGWPKKEGGQSILYEGSYRKMTVEFLTGILFLALKIAAERRCQQTFSSVVISIPLSLDILASYIRYGALRWAGFEKVEIKNETNCIAQKYLRSNNLMFWEGNLLVLSQNSMNVDVVVHCLKGGKMGTVFSAIAFIPDSEAKAFGMATILFVITKFAEYFSKNVMWKPTSEECLLQVFQTRSPKTVLIACKTSAAFNILSIIVKKFAPGADTAILEGALRSL